MPAHTTHIAIVEDHPDVRDALIAYLGRKPGISVLPPCKDMESALMLVEHECPDILLVDLCLPKGGDGEIVIRRAMQRWGSRCTSAVLSGHRREEYWLDAIRGGAKGFVDKNQDPSYWWDNIQMLMAGGSPLNASLARLMLRDMDASEPANLPPATRQTLRTVLQYASNATRLDDLYATPLALPPMEAARLARTAYDALYTPPGLSQRELEYLQLLCAGMPPEQRATSMGIEESTAKTYGQRINAKLGVSSQFEAMCQAGRLGLISLVTSPSMPRQVTLPVRRLHRHET